ncbi:MAG: hypothetical protein ABFD84_14070 [Candidatus Polarisedimenticolia bacterium]
MTWDPGSSYGARLDAASASVVYVAEIEGYPTVYSTGPVVADTWSVKPYLRAPRVELGSIDPLTGDWQLGGTSLVIVDRDGEARRLVATERGTSPIASLRDRAVTLWLGFSGRPQSEYAAVARFAVSGASCDEYGSVTLSCAEPFPALRKPLYTCFGDEMSGRVQHEAASGATQVWVESDTALWEMLNRDIVIVPNTYSQNSTLKPDTRYWHRVTDVLFGVRDPEEGAYAWRLTLDPPLARAMTTDAEWRKAWRIIANPIDMIVRILTGNYGTTGDIQTAFPLTYVSPGFEGETSLALPLSWIDSAAIQAERDAYASGWSGELIVTKQYGSADECLRSLVSGFGSFFSRRSGLLSFRTHRFPIASGTPRQATPANSAGWEWTRSYEDTATTVSYNGDEYDGKSTYVGGATDDDAAGRQTPSTTTYSLAWLRSDRDGASIAATLATRQLSRYSHGHQEIRLRAFLSELRVEPGDVIELTHPAIPDTDTGASLDKCRAEVVSAALDPATGWVEITCWRYASGREGLLAPDSAADYASADATARATYAYQTDDSGQEPDGSSGYVWS